MATGIADPTHTDAPTEERQEVVYLLLDGLRRPDGARRRDAVLCAVGLGRDGNPVPLSMRVVAEETGQVWRDLLADLKARGVGEELRLVCCDDHPALTDAVQAFFPDVPIQISVSHRLLTLARKVDPEWRSQCLAEARQIFVAPDRNAAVVRFRAWRAQWMARAYRAVGSLEADLASCLTFYRFPVHLWPKIRTVNLVERTFRQARRSAPPAPEPEAPEAKALDVETPTVETITEPSVGEILTAEPNINEPSAGEPPTTEAIIAEPLVSEPPATEAFLTLEGDPQGDAGAASTRQAGASAPAGVSAENGRPRPEPSPNGLGRPRRHQAFSWTLAATLGPMRSLQDDFQMLRVSPPPVSEVGGGKPDFAPLVGLEPAPEAGRALRLGHERYQHAGRRFVAGLVTALAGIATGLLLALAR